MHTLIFFTRIPPFKMLYNLDHEKDLLKYFSLTGFLVGLFQAGLFFLLSFFFPHKLSLILSLAAVPLITGALHEDGLADSFDALWGGTNIEKREKILKDSRLGTYGAMILIFSIYLKVESLNAITSNLFSIIIMGHVLSRFLAISPLLFQKYGGTAESKSKNAARELSLKNFLVNILFVIISGLLLTPKEILLSFGTFPVLVIITLIIKQKMGFLRGDFFGMIQQCTEIAFYLLMTLK
ncbi:adenosylcobinamide-GDP ribazoletransferase [Bacteriovoracales bacterium]|nr:adenosylcobinamide-GDP ribazoletransferase [Bacteriovoracales bacterium]